MIRSWAVGLIFGANALKSFCRASPIKRINTRMRSVLRKSRWVSSQTVNRARVSLWGDNLQVGVLPRNVVGYKAHANARPDGVDHI